MIFMFFFYVFLLFNDFFYDFHAEKNNKKSLKTINKHKKKKIINNHKHARTKKTNINFIIFFHKEKIEKNQIINLIILKS